MKTQTPKIQQTRMMPSDETTLEGDDRAGDARLVEETKRGKRRFVRHPGPAVRAATAAGDRAVHPRPGHRRRPGSGDVPAGL